MPSIPLHPPSLSTTPHPSTTITNPLPPLLQTPLGLALLELQSTIHTPYGTSPDQTSTVVGNLVFPLYDSTTTSPEDTSWMKRVYLYIGKHQRLTGEVKKLGKAIAVVARREGGEGDEANEELEVKEVVRYKIVFSSRPEPVGEEMGV